MKRLVIIRKVFKILFPELKVIVRYNKNKDIEIIIKNVKRTYVDDVTYKVMLFITGKQDLVLEDFVNNLFGYCSLINEDNCVIKYLGKHGALRLTTPKNNLINN